MIRAAHALAEARRIPQLGGTIQVTSDYTPVFGRIRDEATTDWNDKIAVDNGQEFVADRAIVIAAGTSAAIPPIEGLADTPYWTNREIVATKQAPESMVVVGGGAVGLELAQAFSRFGTRVDVVEALDRLAPGEEPEASEVIAEVLRGEGIGVHTGAAVRRVSHGGGRFTVELGDTTLNAERLLVATGRKADLAGLGVEAIGLDPNARFVETDEQMRAANGVYALGDVTGKGLFTHVATYQAAIVANRILGKPTHDAEHHAVPRVTFTDPEIGSVGLTEAQARERGLSVRTMQQKVPHSARGWIHKAGNDGLIKLVEDTDRGVLVGATAVGPNGGEVLSGLSVAVHAQVPTERMRQMIYAYPTFNRAIEDALSRVS